MERITVNASTPYEIIIGNNIVNSIGKELARVKAPCKLMLVSDSNVAPLYLNNTVRILEDAGYEVTDFVINSGEESKNKDVLFEILEALAENSFKRCDMLASLGGGVVGDITGFAASVYMRGIDYIQIPTTLLAAVDSSVGGKTAVNLSCGKNLAGSFWQPRLVFCDVNHFKTLSTKMFSAGAAEVIKYGAVLDRSLFEELEKGALVNDIVGVVKKCLCIKKDIVEADELDKGRRMVLNFGHTFGHAVEKVSNYTLPHGLAVGVGMAMITNAAEKIGRCSGVYERLVALLKKTGIDTVCQYTTEEIIAAALSDKKMDKDGITVVLPVELGEHALYKATSYELIKLVELGVN